MMEALLVGGLSDGARPRVKATKYITHGGETYRRIRLPEGIDPVQAIYIADGISDVAGMELLIKGYGR